MESTEDLVSISVTVNGRRYADQVEPRWLLAYWLRDRLGLTGTHVGCDTSQCGVCTVILNGQAVKSCTILAVQADNGTVLTVEGLAQDGTLHPVQAAFSEAHGLQCGFCTPGAEMLAVALLEENPHPTEAEIREALDGLLCRCTGYQHIVQAVALAAERKGRGA
ncbi:MAG: (2Fe-2S)-binding protein [Firmicutes bacterium]|nr:(2Fe-2S)-binding protein [Alicyclobacillaceae bacterium]MCL6496567.1 (2Fe-2S)-binding protein [Bacillota bacterium]